MKNDSLVIDINALGADDIVYLFESLKENYAIIREFTENGADVEILTNDLDEAEDGLERIMQKAYISPVRLVRG
tara:strand:+ start:17817 stop:18038 length:222 start_codon:yes stop_codon:yes gene_type:complete